MSSMIGVFYDVPSNPARDAGQAPFRGRGSSKPGASPVKWPSMAWVGAGVAGLAICKKPCIAAVRRPAREGFYFPQGTEYTLLPLGAVISPG